MCEKMVASLASLCREATGHLSSLCREATGDNNKTDWPAPIYLSVGGYTKHWADGIHDRDGHALWSSPLNTDGEALLLLELNALMCQTGVEDACGDVSNAALDALPVRQARELETKFFTDMGVYTRVPRADQARCKGKFIKTRWININKGDSIAPRCRSISVGEKYKTDADDSLYALTPPSRRFD